MPVQWPVLKADRLVRRYGDFTAVNQVSFDVPKGSCFGLLGPNGAGKTSTIGLLVGLSAPDAGEVTLDGQTLTPNQQSVKRRIGYVPQEVAVYDEISATANLEFIGGVYGLTGSTLSTRIHEALALAGLSDRAKEPVSKFSGGMKRRLNIAMSLIHRPELLILDEPTVGVDPQSRNAIFDALKTLQSNGTTLIYTSHYMEEVERLCDVVAIMDGGKVVANDTVAGLKQLLPASQTAVIQWSDDIVADQVAVLLKQSGFSVRVEGCEVTVESNDLRDTLNQVTRLAQPGQLIGLQSQQTSLEEVFLHLTGRSLRD